MFYFLGFEWQWEKDGTGSTVVFNNDDRDVIFNPGFSVGTAAVRGSLPFKPGYHHYWEIEMSTEVYGTDMVKMNKCNVTLNGRIAQYLMNVLLCTKMKATK